ncbi:kinase-like domain-containing protein, partial [Mycena rosella]
MPNTAPSPPVAQKSATPAPEIPTLADFDVLKPIGKGATSRVFLVRHKLTQKEYALKVAPKPSKTSSDLPLEQAMLRSISQDGSPFLLRLVASWDDSMNYYLLTPWCEGGDLASILLQGRLPRERATEHLAQLILALEDLHSRRILHRDVKPSNIFVDGRGNAILGDLGYGKRFAFSADPQEPDFVEFNADPEAASGSFRWQECVTAERCGTPAFMSPQQHCGEEYSFDVDVWGLGMCFFYMLTGRSPFDGSPRTPEEFAHTFKTAPVRFEEADGLDEDVRDLVRCMLSKNGRSRVALSEIKNHAVFASVDWAALATGTLPTAWASRAPHVPRTPRPDLVVAGEPYAPDLRPEPQFSFVKSNF